MSILDRILEDKRAEVARREREEPLAALRARAERAPSPRSLARALRPRGAAAGRKDDREGEGEPNSPEFLVIAEVKKASPSKGVIRADFDPIAIARAYAAAGAAGLSVLTEEKHFQGRPEFLESIRREVDLPLLRKDFILDPYQVWESRALGADAILLILAAIPDDERLSSLAALARELGMDVLWEAHDDADIRRLSSLRPAIVGINNRDLKTFQVTLETTRRLLPDVPPGAVTVSESGFSSREELRTMAGWGVGAFLIGETLLRAEDPGAALRLLIGKEAPA